MDRRRYRTGLIAALIGAFAAFSFAAYAVQGGPVYQSVPTHPTPGVTACSGNRVWINKDDGTQYCCISSTWQVCPLFLRLPNNTPGSPAASDLWYNGSGLVTGGGLSVTGATTVNSLSVTNLATSGSLSISGATTVNGVRALGQIQLTTSNPIDFRDSSPGTRQIWGTASGIIIGGNTLYSSTSRFDIDSGASAGVRFCQGQLACADTAVGAGGGATVSNLGLQVGITASGSLSTCGSTWHGTIRMVRTAGEKTRLCICTLGSDNTTYAWVNVGTNVAGDTTTCPTG